MMAAYALRPLLLYLHLYAQLVPRKPSLDDPHTELLPAALDRWPIATPPFKYRGELLAKVSADQNGSGLRRRCVS